EIHRHQRAVRVNRHGEPEAAVDSTARTFGIVEIPDALDLLAPVLDIECVANLGGTRAHEGLARTLVVLLDLTCDLRFHPSNDQGAFGEIRSGDLRPNLCLRFWLGRGDIFSRLYSSDM